MSKAIRMAALALASLASPAMAQSWGLGVGVEIGAPPVYYDPPPVYYERSPDYYAAPPVIGAPPPRVYYAPAPLPPPALEIVSPGEVLDRLDAAGYTNLQPMAHRRNIYRLNAVDPYGNLVALRISVFTGEIERTDILQAAYAPAPPPAAPRRIARPVAAVPPARLPQAAPPPQPVAAAPQGALPPPRQATAAPPPSPPQTAAAAPPPPPPSNGEPPPGADDPLVIY